MHHLDDHTHAPSDLLAIRSEIDRVDQTLVDLIARRAALAWSTAPLKAAGGHPFRDHRREAGLVRRAAALARKRGIDPEPVRAIFWRLVELSHLGVGPSPGDGAVDRAGGDHG